MVNTLQSFDAAAENKSKITKNLQNLSLTNFQSFCSPAKYTPSPAFQFPAALFDLMA